MLNPHWDALGEVWDIGYGHVLQPTDPRVSITQAEADALFELDLLHYEDQVTQMTAGVELRQHEADAILSLSYNCGHEAIEKSTLLKHVLAGEFAHAACEFPKWCKAGGKDVLGLLKRRCAEQAIFLLADYSRGLK